jgi:hypothetical protein
MALFDGIDITIGTKKTTTPDPVSNRTSILKWINSNITTLTGKDENGNQVKNEDFVDSKHGDYGRIDLSKSVHPVAKMELDPVTGKKRKVSDSNGNIVQDGDRVTNEINAWNKYDDGSCSIFLKCGNAKMYPYKGDDVNLYKTAEIFVPLSGNDDVKDMVAILEKTKSNVNGCKDIAELGMCIVKKKDNKVIKLTEDN